ncbi:DUF1707 domain-containing protein [Nonomuraea sp. NPDC050153]|uniref:DUF1707 SHOCT-like domain-containing protein n=1 Tax=Nonomuraea sp. NPDC050153 TaxID=3364359 RepID=UPI003796CEDF
MTARAGGPDHRPPPISDDDRDTGVRRVQEAYAGGLISYEEMDARLQQVLTARMHGELVTALAPLPEEDADTTATITAVGGRIVRRGAWRIPRVLRVESALGRVHLDLSRAIIEHPVVDIELRLGTGRARITVPRDAIVDVEGLRTGWRDPIYQTRRSSRPGGPRIRISGAMGMGRLKIRHARR